jgi:hypothetical protein
MTDLLLSHEAIPWLPGFPKMNYFILWTQYFLLTFQNLNYLIANAKLLPILGNFPIQCRGKATAVSVGTDEFIHGSLSNSE